MTDKTVKIPLALLEQLVEVLEGVEALIEHQYTGTREAMNALQNASDDAQEAIEPLRSALAQQPLELRSAAEAKADREHAEKYLRQAEFYLTSNEETLHAEIDRLKAALAQQGEQPVTYQYQSMDGTWHPFLNEKHYADTVEDGRWPIRALYAAAPAPAQPVGPNIQNYLEKDNRLSDDEILSIAHRKATRYTHAVAPGQVTYGFSVTHLLDFARAVLEENPKHLVAAQPKTCETCAHFEQGKLPGVRIHDETCYGCRQYYGSQWEARNE